MSPDRARHIALQLQHCEQPIPPDATPTRIAVQEMANAYSAAIEQLCRQKKIIALARALVESDPTSTAGIYHRLAIAIRDLDPPLH